MNILMFMKLKLRQPRNTIFNYLDQALKYILVLSGYNFSGYSGLFSFWRQECIC